MALPTPAVDIGIDDSCTVLEPIDFITSYMDPMPQQPVSYKKECNLLIPDLMTGDDIYIFADLCEMLT